MKRYKVQFLQNDTYQVIETGNCIIQDNSQTIQVQITPQETIVFQGSLSDCEAYIRLNEGGYM